MKYIVISLLIIITGCSYIPTSPTLGSNHPEVGNPINITYSINYYAGTADDAVAYPANLSDISFDPKILSNSIKGMLKNNPMINVFRYSNSPSTSSYHLEIEYFIGNRFKPMAMAGKFLHIKTLGLIPRYEDYEADLVLTITDSEGYRVGRKTTHLEGYDQFGWFTLSSGSSFTPKSSLIKPKIDQIVKAVEWKLAELKSDKNI